MKFHVNANCIGCGLCEGLCPEVFRMTDAGTACAIDEDVDSALETAALETQGGCPASAIETI